MEPLCACSDAVMEASSGVYAVRAVDVGAPAETCGMILLAMRAPDSTF